MTFYVVPSFLMVEVQSRTTVSVYRTRMRKVFKFARGGSANN